MAAPTGPHPFCEECGTELLPHVSRYRRVSGWANVARAGGVGGINHLSCVEPQDRWLCTGCIVGERKRWKGSQGAVAKGQQSLA